MVRIYIYGVIKANREVDLGVGGVDDASPVRLVVNEGLGGVVSHYGGEEFAALSRERLVRSLLAHQWVVERIMQEHTVLPVKFGTLVDSLQDVRDLLSQGRPRFASALAETRDKVEVEVAATWDTRRVLQEIAAEEEVARARDAVARGRRPTLEEQVWVGRMVKASMDRRRDAYRQRMVEVLRPRCVDLAANALVSDEMVMNVAFLVDRAREQEFDAAVQQMDRFFRHEINFRVIGPLPPYSFSTVEVTRLTPGQVEEARRTLRLDGVPSEAEIRRAYRQVAAAGQQSLRAGTGLVTGLMGKLREASEVLLRYHRAQGEAQGLGRPQGLDRPNLFDIAIKKARSDDIAPARFGAAVRVG